MHIADIAMALGVRFVSMVLALVLVLTVLTVHGHSQYTGKCPDLRPMKNFDWDKVK